MTFEERARALVAQMTLPEKMSQLRYDAPAIPRLNIPAYNWWNECLHGAARSGTATVFPQAIAMAAAFNAPLLEEVADAISDEVRAKYNRFKTFGGTEIYQGLTCWAPNINIFRDPRWGRGHETYGEDPFLTGRLGAAFVRGLQGKDPKYRKVDATLKHFCAHSGPESIRHGFDAVVSEEDMQSTYLPAFRYCIENTDVAAVMGAYNSVNGEPCCGSEKILEELLRGELGFEGYVVSDCGAVRDIDQYHHKTASPAESAALAVNSGCDLNCGSAYTWLQAAYEQGLVSEEAITRSAERLFTARFRLGMFDDDCPYDSLGVDVLCSPAHKALNREMARQGIVLLKNNGILPLKGSERIAVIGPNADDVSVLLGNYNGIPDQYTTLLRGIQEAAEGRVLYAKGCHHYDPKAPRRAEFPVREAVLAARDSDVVILCTGLTPEMEGEEGDAYNGCNGGDKFDLELPVPQKELFEAVLAEGKPIIFVNVSGSAINLCRQDETCAAVLQCFYPGAEGGHALADILFGKANPSGRLPVTFYRSADDLPDFTDYAMKGRTYRFFEGKPLYPFGYGLSYTNFTEEQLDENHVRVTNTGSMDGWHTVLKFAPHLAGFQKVFLKAGESAVLSFKP